MGLDPPRLGTIFGTFPGRLMETNLLFFLNFLRPSFGWDFIDFYSILGVLFEDSLGLWVNFGNSDFAIHSMWNHRFQGSVGSVFCVFWHTFLGLLGACFFRFWVFVGATFGSLVVPKVAFGVVLEASKKLWKKGLNQKKEFQELGGGSTIITSGLWPSWGILGGSSWQRVTPCARSAVADMWSHIAECLFHVCW